jgi:hypothetical protein
MALPALLPIGRMTAGSEIGRFADRADPSRMVAMIVGQPDRRTAEQSPIGA